MRFLRFTTTLFFLFSSLLAIYAQPKREFRAVWVANVSNVDWPSAKNLSPDQQQAELVALLNLHQKQGINAVFFQVRNACDALYESPYEPWSEWLMGTQGQSPGYDPLAFFIQECRKRNIEAHAWLNPYRAVVNTASSSVAANHISKTRPEWIQTYNTSKILDPGLPEVRAYLLKIVMDVVRRYDIDGIHFDDYFYPYPQAGFTFNDDATFARNNRGMTNKNDWRRENVNLMIKAVSDSLRAIKPWVKFGTSPFGIWQNRGSSTLGSATSGLESYSAIYADSRKWAQQGWLDYIVPQVYWSIGFSAANFSVLVPWWVNNSYEAQLYIGHGAYQVNTSTTDANWKKNTELPDQIKLVRNTAGAMGSVFFSSKSLKNNALGLADSLQNNYYRKPALVPVMAKKDIVPPSGPSRVTAKLNTDNTVTLSWTFPFAPVSELDKPRTFVIYRSNSPTIDQRTAKDIYALVAANSGATSYNFTDRNIEAGVAYNYAVSTVDRLANESAITAAISPEMLTSVAENPAKMTVSNPSPDERLLIFQAYPNPFNKQVTLRYKLEKTGEVSLNVYDQRGIKVAALVNERQSAGTQIANFNGEFLTPGVYVARLEINGVRQTLKLIIN